MATTFCSQTTYFTIPLSKEELVEKIKEHDDFEYLSTPPEDCFDELEGGGQYVVSYDSDGECTTPDLEDYKLIQSVFFPLQTGLSREVWHTENSREGNESGVNFYNSDGEEVDVCELYVKSEQLLNSIADALWGEGSDSQWSADTIQAIADAITTERPDLVEARGGKEE